MARVGVKVFFTINPSDLPALRRAMGTDHGRQFKRESSGGHPPAIELYLSNRYFAVTCRISVEESGSGWPVTAK